MPNLSLKRRLLAEALGTSGLLIAVVGSGIMAQSLSPENIGVALLANAIATGCALYVLIATMGPISGAHFNPAVTLAFRLRGEIATRDAVAYVGVQIAAGVVGVLVAHAMFAEGLVQVSTTARGGRGAWIAEGVATFGLLLAIFGGVRHVPGQVPALVAVYITGAYWFTASTSFANPAVTVARSLTDTFAGIAPMDAPGFILAQLIAVLLAIVATRALFDAR